MRVIDAVEDEVQARPNGPVDADSGLADSIANDDMGANEPIDEDSDSAPDRLDGDSDETGITVHTIPGTAGCEAECEGLECGPDLVCGESCGSCTSLDRPACNAWQCEAECDPDRCGEMSWCEPWLCDTEEFCSDKGTEVRTCHYYECELDNTCDELTVEEVGGECNRDTEGWELTGSRLGRGCEFVSFCAEEGSQEMTAEICREGILVEEYTFDEVCERDTAGIQVPETSSPGECQFESVCAELGTREISAEVCRDGVPTLEVVTTESCGRETDGTEVPDSASEGECGGFDDACDEGGSATVTVLVCYGGEAVEEGRGTVACERETDGDLVEDSRIQDECANFPTDCAEEGQAAVRHQICQDGKAETVELDPVSCLRETDGSEVKDTRVPANCRYEHHCSLEGSRTVNAQVCREGEPQDELVATELCERNTEGNELPETRSTGTCGGFQSFCDEEGTAPVSASVCRSGSPTTETVEYVVCSQETDGEQLEGTRVVGRCASFDDECDRTGLAPVTIQSCVDGEPQVIEQEAEFCERETNGNEVSNTRESATCENFADTCDETGTADVTALVCQDGVSSRQKVATESCERDTDGREVADTRSTGDCEYATFCAEAGAAPISADVCRDGTPIEEVVDSEVCTQDTEALEVPDSLETGECGGFTEPCDETGVASQTVLVCRSGTPNAEDAGTVGCEQDTDGDEVEGTREGGECGYSSFCDEGASQPVTADVCREGVPTNEVVDNDVCVRDTDGWEVPDSRSTGECGYSSYCDQTASAPISAPVCVGGTPVSQVVASSPCSRNREGLQVPDTLWTGSCGGFTSFCDESGTRPRTADICRGGTATNESLSGLSCSQDTDDLEVPGTRSWSGCDYTDYCDKSATDTQTADFCSDGNPITEITDTTSCSRNNDGNEVPGSRGPGECDWSSSCDEDAQAQITREVCRTGSPLTEVVGNQNCTRETDGDSCGGTGCSCFSSHCDCN